ncbi:MAG: T9SS type A sorting domain-containing protein, partial [Chitinophagales bacterium]|nr:T9SS type A sorting domain-containing protein [Chitinophagales bacterium]
IYPIIINLEAISTDSVNVEIYAHGKDDFDEIRFKNDGGSWSDWMTFNENEFNWTIAGTSGENTVIAEMKNGSITKSSQDEIEYNGVSTSINDGFDGLELEFFPNPAVNILYLYNVEKYTSYRVYNIQGQEVVNGNFAGRSASQEINVEHLNKGQFLLILQSAASTTQELFLKM